nr:hypothetical protein [Tanacetum cinerariifolium]
MMSNNKRLLGDIDEEDDDENEFEDDVDNNDVDSNDNDESDDERTKSDRDEIPYPNLTNVPQNNKMLLISQSGFGQEQEDAHVTLTHVLNTQKTRGPIQSSSVSYDFTSKLLNLDNPSPANNEIASFMNTLAYHPTTILKITSSFATPTLPLPILFNPLQQEATPTPTPTTSKATTSFTSLLDFTSVFKFNERVTNLEKDMSDIKQVDQYAQALSSVPSTVDRYMDNKLGEVINKVIQAHNFDCQEEAQAEKREYIELVELTSSYEAAATLSEFELTKILIDKMEKNKSFDVAN